MKNIRPNEDQIKAGKEFGWDGDELKYGYGKFQDFCFEYIAKIDDMDVFDSDRDAAIQAQKDGHKLLKFTKAQENYIWGEYGEDPKTILDTDHNRMICRELFPRSKKFESLTNINK